MRILMTLSQAEHLETLDFEGQIDFKIQLMREQEKKEEKEFLAYLRSLSLKRPELRKVVYEYARSTENL